MPRKRKEQAILRKEERERNREIKRSDRQVSGVSFDTTLPKKKPEVREIMPSIAPVEPMDLPFPEVVHPEMKLVMPADDFVINRAEPEEIVPEPEPVSEPVTKKKEKVDVASEVASVEAVIEQSNQETETDL